MGGEPSSETTDNAVTIEIKLPILTKSKLQLETFKRCFLGFFASAMDTTITIDNRYSPLMTV